MREIGDLATLESVLDSETPLRGLRIQGVDLRPVAGRLRERTDLHGLAVLGGTVPPELTSHLVRFGALVFPSVVDVPVDPYRSRLYRPAELYDGLDQDYSATVDARAYAWSRDARIGHDVLVTHVRALHDDAMSDALGETLTGRRVVGIMGGHALHRGRETFAAAASLGHELAEADFVVATGGGPGAMEAANLGAFAPTRALLDAALAELGEAPGYEEDLTAWARAGFAVRDSLAEARTDDDALRSLGIPTWFYGHEPPNVFGDRIAKYFSNALREDGLLARANAGIIVLPGAAGTAQEVFQAVTPMYYAKDDAAIAPLVLVGLEQWSEIIPLWSAIKALAAGRSMADRVHLVDTVEEAARIIAA